ncbi:MAG: GNAT family N-acetyltransferase [Planctomycetota bacterium]
MHDFTLRSATRQDLDSLVELNAIVQALHHDARPERFRPVASAEVRVEFARRLDDPDSRAWLAVDGDGGAVGYAMAVPRSREKTPFAWPRHWVELDEMGVLPEWRGKGIGRSLIEKVAESADGLDVELTVWSFNETAQSVYAAAGFVPQTVRMARRASDQT